MTYYYQYNHTGLHKKSLLYSCYSLCIIFWIIGYCPIALVFNKLIFVLELELLVVRFVCVDFFAMPHKPEKSLWSYNFMLAFLIITPFGDSSVVFDKPWSTFKAFQSVIGAYVNAYLNIQSFKLFILFMLLLSCNYPLDCAPKSLNLNELNLMFP